MKITKNLVPIDKGVDSIRVLHGKRFDLDGFIAKAKKENKEITVRKKDGRVIRIN